MEVPKKQKYRKEKPWDTPDIDKWALPSITPEDHPYPFAEESSFATLFPKYRENYLREIWPQLTRDLEKVGIACVLDLVEGSMTVKTTRKTWDPYMILKARDLIKLLARSVPVGQAIKILEPEMNCEIVKVGNIVRNKERFVKRRQRLIGPNGNTLKALELLTGCYILVQGNTVAIMGSYSGLKQVRRIILDCMKNIHPIYHIKELMIKRELGKDPTLSNENWQRFLPQFKKTREKIQKVRKDEADDIREEMDELRKKTSKNTVKKKYTPFPPAQLPRKIDMEIEDGSYFLTSQQKFARTMAKKKESQILVSQEKKKQRAEAFVPPLEASIVMKASMTERSIDELKDKIIRSSAAKRLNV